MPQRWALMVLALCVLVFHLVVANRIAQSLVETHWRAQKPARMTVTYVRELALQTPKAHPVIATPAVQAVNKITPSLPAVLPGTTLARLRIASPARTSRAIKSTAHVAQKTLIEPSLAASSAAQTASAASSVDVVKGVLTSAASGVASLVSTVETVNNTASSEPEPVLLRSPDRPAWTESAPRHTPSGRASAASASSTASNFEWPDSTRLSYKVTGQYRGEIHGQAQVEWISSPAASTVSSRISAGGQNTVIDTSESGVAETEAAAQPRRYQVHMDVTVGLPIAPLLTRRMSSDGRLSSEGLTPERYDEETKLMGSPPKRHVLQFDATGVILPNGQRYYTQAAVQDPASQFVQLAYRFAHHPEQLSVGGVIELDLALPRQVSRRQFDVLAQELVYTPFGALNAFHLKMRRTSASKSGDFDPEVWLVPELRFLPARMRIQQGEENYLDMVLMRRPEVGEAQAAEAR